MRAPRVAISILAGLALATLLSAPTMAATDEPPAVVAVTGTVVEAIVHNEVLYDEYLEERVRAEGDGYDIHIGGPNLIEQTVEWSDPRLPTKQWMTLSYHNFSELAAGAATTNRHHPPARGRVGALDGPGSIRGRCR